MARSSSAWTRIRAWMDFEVTAEPLEACRRAGVLVDEVQRLAADHRLACAMEGRGPWDLPSGTRAGLVCAWNALVLQTLGDALLLADDQAHPPTAGFVPRDVHDEAAAYYAQVEAWVDRARQGFANPGYRLDLVALAALPVPAARPFAVQGMRDARRAGLADALRQVRQHAAEAMALLPAQAADPAGQAQLDTLRRAHASAEAAAHRVDGRVAGDAACTLEEVRGAIAGFHALGQRLSDPALAEEAVDAIPAGPWGALDLWCLTHPAARQAGTADAASLEAMWVADPHGVAALHASLTELLDRGDMEHASPDAGSAPYWLRCPWGPVYVARRPCVLNGVRVPAGQAFVVDAETGPGEETPSLSCRLATASARRPGVAARGRGDARPGREGAEPSLPAGPARPVRVRKPKPLPGQPGFDAWCLTAPWARVDRESNPAARRALKRLWRADPDPARTLAILAEIQAAMDDGDVVFATGEGAVSRRSCPWGPVYVAQRDLVLGNVYLRVGQRFIYETRTSGRDGFVRRVRRKPDLLPGMPDDAG